MLFSTTAQSNFNAEGVLSQVVVCAHDITARNDIMTMMEVAFEQIYGVARDIFCVSKKTNLLAPNATIQAARAGDSNKGFNVVASEVKTLTRRITGDCKSFCVNAHDCYKRRVGVIFWLFAKRMSFKHTQVIAVSLKISIELSNKELMYLK